MGAWKLETAKAKLSEVVRQAQTEGPQIITVRGQDAVVVVSAERYRSLAGDDKARNWVQELRQGLDVGFDFDFERDQGVARDVEL